MMLPPPPLFLISCHSPSVFVICFYVPQWTTAENERGGSRAFQLRCTTVQWNSLDLNVWIIKGKVFHWNLRSLLLSLCVLCCVFITILRVQGENNEGPIFVLNRDILYIKGLIEGTHQIAQSISFLIPLNNAKVNLLFRKLISEIKLHWN